jgi:hypothetical protein
MPDRSAARQQRTVEIFVAGVCDSVGGPGGWGAVLRYGMHRHELHGAELTPTTIERMQLKAMTEALTHLTRPASVLLHAVPTIGDRHADLKPMLASAAHRHEVEWTGITTGAEDARAVSLARKGQLDAVQELGSRCIHDLITSQ